MAKNKTSSPRSFKDYVLKKDAFGQEKPSQCPGRYSVDQAEWKRGRDGWEWPSMGKAPGLGKPASRVAGPSPPALVARDDDPRDGLASLESPGLGSPSGFGGSLKKMPGKGRMAPAAMKASGLRAGSKPSARLREWASKLSDREYVGYMLEELDQARKARPIPLVSDLNGNQYTPHPEEAMRYVASLASQSPMMMSRLIGSLKDSGVIDGLVKELVGDSEAIDCLVGEMGDPDVGPSVAGRFAKAMYDQASGRAGPPPDAATGGVAEAVAGPAWQEAPPGFDPQGQDEDGQDQEGGQADDQPPGPDLPPAAPEPAVPGEDDQALDIGPPPPGDEMPGDASDGGGEPPPLDIPEDGGPAPDDETGSAPDAELEAEDDTDDQIGSFAGGGQGGVAQPSSAAGHLVQAMRRYKPLADLVGGA